MDPVAPADFHELVGVEDPAVHPAGDRVAFVRREPESDDEYGTAIHVAEVPSGDTRRLTVESGTDSQPRWHPDGDSLAFVSDRLTDDERPQLWLLPLDGGEARQVTEVAGGVSELAWSPDGSTLLFTQSVTPEDAEAGRDIEVPASFEPEEPDPRVIDRTIYRAHERYFDRRRSRLYLVDPADDTVEPIDDWADADQVMPVWGDDQTIFYLERVGEDPDDSLDHALIARDLAEETAETVAHIEGYPTGIAATSDGQVIAAYNPTPRPTLKQTRLERIDTATGDRVELATALDRSVYGPIRLDSNESNAFVLTPDTGAVVIRQVPLDGGKTTVHTGEDATVAGFDLDGGTLAYVQSEWDHPGDLFAQEIGSDDESRLTVVNADYLESHEVTEPEAHWFEGSDGEIQGWLLTPPASADATDPYPLVLEIHGGPHSMWTTSGTMWHEFQSLAGAGYAVLWTNPRGSIGYGQEHAAAIADDWGDVTHDDLMVALDAVVGRDDIDEEQLFVTGGSFGGYQTSWTIGRTDRFEAAVAQRGVYDLPAFFGTSDAYRLIESEFDATPWDDQSYLYERSPTSLVESVDTPTLLIHSDDDYRTPAATAEMYFRALRKLEVPTRLVRYPREGHELSRSGEPAHRVDRIERIIRWFDGYATHTEVPPALERPPNEGLSIDEDEDEE